MFCSGQDRLIEPSTGALHQLAPVHAKMLRYSRPKMAVQGTLGQQTIRENGVIPVERGPLCSQGAPLLGGDKYK